MRATKLHIWCVVLATVWSGLYLDGGVPYFPIEISRTATGPVAARIFFWGMLLIPLTTLSLDRMLPSRSLCCAWLGLQLITFFDDVNHWSLHMAGVAVLFLSVLVHHDHEAFVAAVLVYCARIVLKAWAIIVLEAVFPASVSALSDAGFGIMMGTRVPQHWATLWAFKCAGVMQWIALALLTTIV